MRINMWSVDEPNTRFRARGLLAKLERNEQMGNATHLDEWETGLVAELLRRLMGDDDA